MKPESVSLSNPLDKLAGAQLLIGSGPSCAVESDTPYLIPKNRDQTVPEARVPPVGTENLKQRLHQPGSHTGQILGLHQ